MSSIRTFRRPQTAASPEPLSCSQETPPSLAYGKPLGNQYLYGLESERSRKRLLPSNLGNRSVRENQSVGSAGARVSLAFGGVICCRLPRGRVGAVTRRTHDPGVHGHGSHRVSNHLGIRGIALANREYPQAEPPALRLPPLSRHRGGNMSSRDLGFVGRSLVVTALVLTLAACASLQTGSDFDRTVNMSGYHTFAWMPREHYGTHNPLVIQRARDAIQGSLVGKGFAYVEDSTKADFVVDFTSGAHDRTDIQSYPVSYAGPLYPGYYGWWGRPYWGETSMCGSIVKAQCRSMCLMCARTGPSGMVGQRRN